MKSCSSTIGLSIALFAFFGFQPAEAGCQLIHATHSARSQAKAVQTSQALALRSAYDLQRAMGWATSLCLLTRCRESPSGRPFVPTGFQRTQDLGPTWSPRSSTRLVSPAW